MYPAFVKSFCKVEMINLMILLNYYFIADYITSMTTIWMKSNMDVLLLFEHLICMNFQINLTIMFFSMIHTITRSMSHIDLQIVQNLKCVKYVLENNLLLA